MARKKTKRDKPKERSAARATSLPASAIAWHRVFLTAGALLLALLLATASIHAPQAETTPNQLTRLDVISLVRTMVALQRESRDALYSPGTTTWRLPSVPARSNYTAVPKGTAGGAVRAWDVDARVAGALHVRSVEMTRKQLHGSNADPRLAMVTVAPPYALSGPGGFQTRVAHVSGIIERSLFESGVSVGLSDRQILTLADIFGWDIDFAHDVKVGDSFSAIYEEKYWLGSKIDNGPILAAEFVNRGHTYRAIGMRASSGQLLYFAPSGRSLKQTFLRAPVKFSRVSSGYSDTRYHPILKLWRAHTGVDYSAPAGTPVRATADGSIVAMSWNGGYGRTIEIDHGSSYSTLYAHLQGYRPDLTIGTAVEQGDIIGFVGSSGLATGPHLHYEFQVNGQHRDPLAYQSSDSELIPYERREEFRRVAETWSTELDRISPRYFASR